MAIHPEFPGVEVTIEVDGVALREYASDEDQQPQVTTTCYVESQAGKNFIVMLKFPEDFVQMQQSDIEAILTVDGQRMRSLVIHGAKNGRGQKSWDGVRDKEGETCLLRKFMFAPLNMDSASQSASTGTPEEIGQLGQIVVTFNRGTYRRGSDSHISKQVRAFKDLGKIDEKMLKGKAISHSAALGDAVPASSTPTPCKFDVKEENPFASFKILYRSHDDLKSEMIIPRSPTPAALEDRDINDLTPEEMRERLRRLELANTRIKPEPKREVKRERATSISSTDSDELTIIEPPAKRLKNIETIDLTGL